MDIGLANLRQVLAVASVACIIGCTSATLPATTRELGSITGLITDEDIEIEGVVRTFDFFVPTDLGETGRPLVFLFHGAKSTTDYLTGQKGFKAPYSVWMEIAETEKLILVYPQGTTAPLGGLGWNDCRADATTTPSEDDVAFVETLIDYFSNRFRIDTNRIYASGTSNGGHMSLRIAHELSDKFAAVAPIVAAMPAVSCNVLVNPISVLFMNGTADPLLPYHGGEIAANAGGRGTVLSTQESVKAWVKFNQTSRTGAVIEFPDIDPDDGSTVTSTTYSGGAAGTEVVLYEIAGGGHVEPSVREQYSRIVEGPLGPQNHDIEMAIEVWHFFRSKTLN